MNQSKFFIAVSILLSIIIFGILLHTGTKEGYMEYFGISNIVSIFVLNLFSKEKIIINILQSSFLTILTVIIADLFWNFMEMKVGDFNFENEIMYSIIIGFGALAFLIGTLLNILKSKLLNN